MLGSAQWLCTAVLLQQRNFSSKQQLRARCEQIVVCCALEVSLLFAHTLVSVAFQNSTRLNEWYFAEHQPPLFS
jgi:hypothetical protein